MSESKAKQLRKATVPEHVHCRECQCALDPNEAKPGGALTPVAGPNGQGIGFMMRAVPLCPECFERIQANERKLSSKLIVPELKARPAPVQ